MIITRIYTGEDKQSHMEDLEVPEHSVPNILQQVSSITFRSHEPDRFSDWHCESKRNYIITLSGEGEIGLGDGSIHKIGRDTTNQPDPRRHKQLEFYYNHKLLLPKNCERRVYN